MSVSDFSSRFYVTSSLSVDHKALQDAKEIFLSVTTVDSDVLALNGYFAVSLTVNGRWADNGTAATLIGTNLLLNIVQRL